MLWKVFLGPTDPLAWSEEQKNMSVWLLCGVARLKMIILLFFSKAIQLNIILYIADKDNYGCASVISLMIPLISGAKMSQAVRRQIIQ